jgi:hydrogenase/urease accessory protein HupE
MSRVPRLLARVLARVVVLACFGLFAAAAVAHELTMAEMEVRETAKGEFFWTWTATERRVGNADLVPVWPSSCTAQDNALHCGEAGLRGELSIQGVGQRYSAAIVKVFWLDGQSRVYTVTAGQPTVRLYGTADDERGRGEIVSAYLVLGIEHILSGIDHLMFVISLLFLVGFNRRLLWTITAFTAAHSITLASSALGLLVLRSPPVEATIALSIMLVAGEALHHRETLSRRWPALVAFLFGLVHGLGFAGALKEIGLPQAHLPVALVTFNLGVEIGQLMVVSLAWMLWRVASRWPVIGRARTAVLYGIGSIAAYWSLLRIVALVG